MVRVYRLTSFYHAFLYRTLQKLHFFFTVAFTRLCTYATVYFGQSPIFEHLSTFQYFAIIQKGSNENLVHIVGSVLSMQSPRDGIAGPKT